MTPCHYDMLPLFAMMMAAGWLLPIRPPVLIITPLPYAITTPVAAYAIIIGYVIISLLMLRASESPPPLPPRPR
jgi:hypothetical protein